MKLASNEITQIDDDLPPSGLYAQLFQTLSSNFSSQNDLKTNLGSFFSIIADQHGVDANTTLKFLNVEIKNIQSEKAKVISRATTIYKEPEGKVTLLPLVPQKDIRKL